MIGIQFDFSVLAKQQEVLERALTTHPDTQKVLRKVLRKVILEARRDVVRAARNKMHSDPRNTAEAVRTTVYRKVLGGNISIFETKKAHGSNSYTPPRHPSPRGGNRRTASSRTKQINSYAPLDRGFILRFINAGTEDRFISFKTDTARNSVHRGARGGNVEKYGKTINTGHRGRLRAGNFFASNATAALQRVMPTLSAMIDEEIGALINN